jgi:4-hydroxy-3-methylbut-2-enyl diphosphate reductase
MKNSFQLFLASPRGFCAGVERAIETVQLCLERFHKPVYVLHEIVHNRHVLEDLRQRGAIFVEHLDDIPTGKVCIFSAHGVSAKIEKTAADLGLNTIDATCPLVSSVHRMVEKYHREGCEVIIIGHHKHPEVEGTSGRVAGKVQVVANEEEAAELTVRDPDRVAYVTQTTLNKEEIVGIIEVLQQRFPGIKGPTSNICFATQNRQNAVRLLAETCDLIFVVGSKNSSNSSRLREVAQQCGVVAHLIDDYRDIDEQWLEGKRSIGITAGASAPEQLVDGVLQWMKEHGATSINELKGIVENIHFQPAVIPEESPKTKTK